MFLYTAHGSSGTRHTSDEQQFYFTDVENPTAENPVKYAISVIISGIDARPEYGNIDVVGKVAVMSWENGEEKNFQHYMVKFPKRLLIGFLNDIQTDHILFSDGDYSAVQVDVDSPSYYRFFYPRHESDGKKISR